MSSQAERSPDSKPSTNNRSWFFRNRPKTPAKLPSPLFGPEFYGNVHRVLTDAGIVISQAESPFYEPEGQTSLLRILHGIFERVQLYNYSNLTYPGGLWSFSYACKGDLCPIGDFDLARVADSGLGFRYYSEAVHRAAFAHPQFQADRLAEYLTPPKG